MQEAFPDYPVLSSIRGPRSFSLPQQTYLVLFCLLEWCRAEARCRFEQDHSQHEREQMSRRGYAERLDAYYAELGYDEILTLFLQAKRYLFDWGVEQLQHDPRTPPFVLEALADKDFIWKRPRLLQPFIEICLHLEEHPPLYDDRSR